MIDPLLLDVPVRLETERLILRPYRAGDGPALHEALVESLAELRRFLGHLPWVAEEQTLDSAEIRCRRCAAKFLAREDLPYLLFEKINGRLVGSVGLHRTDWSLPKTEVGFWIRTSASGKGYMTEAVNALVAWAFAELGVQRVELVTDEANAASRNVAARCGFQLEGILQHTFRAPDGTLRNNCIFARLPSAQ